MVRQQLNSNFLKEKAVGTTKQIEEGRKKPKAEKQEGMRQHHHSPHAKCREDRNPKYHEEKPKDVARVLAAHKSPKIAEKEMERNVACGHNCKNAMNESQQHHAMEATNCHQNARRSTNSIATGPNQPPSSIAKGY
jgi:hypothetical protein